MDRLRPSPAPTSGLTRGLFEHTLHTGDTLHETLIRVDTEIANLVRRHDGQFPSAVPEVDERLEAMEHQLTDQIRQHPPEQYRHDWNAYFHSFGRLALLEPSLKAPLLYAGDSGPRWRGERKRLAGGIYGLSALALESALDIYDHPGRYQLDYHRDHRELVGAINELTAVALPNRDQDPAMLATPALYHEDHEEKTDVNLWLATRHSSGRLRVQVKTTEHPDQSLHGFEGVVVYSDDLSNQLEGRQTFPTARLILKELNGAGFSTRDKARLDAASARFQERLDTKVAQLLAKAS